MPNRVHCIPCAYHCLYSVFTRSTTEVSRRNGTAFTMRERSRFLDLRRSNKEEECKAAALMQWLRLNTRWAYGNLLVGSPPESSQEGWDIRRWQSETLLYCGSGTTPRVIASQSRCPPNFRRAVFASSKDSIGPRTLHHP